MTNSGLGRLGRLELGGLGRWGRLELGGLDRWGRLELGGLGRWSRLRRLELGSKLVKQLDRDGGLDIDIKGDLGFEDDLDIEGGLGTSCLVESVLGRSWASWASRATWAARAFAWAARATARAACCAMIFFTLSSQDVL